MTNCGKCSNRVPENSTFCNHCGERLFFGPLGKWRVTTEGDCEGKSTKDLGVHEGFIDEIARMLAPQKGYVLNFRWVGPVMGKEHFSKIKDVTICIEDFRSFNHDQLAERGNILFRNRPVGVCAGEYSQSYKITFKD